MNEIRVQGILHERYKTDFSKLVHKLTHTVKAPAWSVSKACGTRRTCEGEMRGPLRDQIQNAINRVLSESLDSQAAFITVGGRRRNRKKKQKKNGISGSAWSAIQLQASVPPIRSQLDIPPKAKGSPQVTKHKKCKDIKARLSPPRCRKGLRNLGKERSVERGESFDAPDHVTMKRSQLAGSRKRAGYLGGFQTTFSESICETSEAADTEKASLSLKQTANESFSLRDSESSVQSTEASEYSSHAQHSVSISPNSHGSSQSELSPSDSMEVQGHEQDDELSQARSVTSVVTEIYSLGTSGHESVTETTTSSKRLSSAPSIERGESFEISSPKKLRLQSRTGFFTGAGGFQTSFHTPVVEDPAEPCEHVDGVLAKPESLTEDADIADQRSDTSHELVTESFKASSLTEQAHAEECAMEADRFQTSFHTSVGEDSAEPCEQSDKTESQTEGADTADERSDASHEPETESFKDRALTEQTRAMSKSGTHTEDADTTLTHSEVIHDFVAESFKTSALIEQAHTREQTHETEQTRASECAAETFPHEENISDITPTSPKDYGGFSFTTIASKRSFSAASIERGESFEVSTPRKLRRENRDGFFVGAGGFQTSLETFTTGDTESYGEDEDMHVEPGVQFEDTGTKNVVAETEPVHDTMKPSVESSLFEELERSEKINKETSRTVESVSTSPLAYEHESSERTGQNSSVATESLSTSPQPYDGVSLTETPSRRIVSLASIERGESFEISTPRKLRRQQPQQGFFVGAGGFQTSLHASVPEEDFPTEHEKENDSSALPKVDSSDPKSPTWLQKAVAVAKDTYTSLEKKLKRKSKKKKKTSSDRAVAEKSDENIHDEGDDDGIGEESDTDEDTDEGGDMESDSQPTTDSESQHETPQRESDGHAIIEQEHGVLESEDKPGNFVSYARFNILGHKTAPKRTQSEDTWRTREGDTRTEKIRRLHTEQASSYEPFGSISHAYGELRMDMHPQERQNTNPFLAEFDTEDVLQPDKTTDMRQLERRNTNPFFDDDYNTETQELSQSTHLLERSNTNPFLDSDTDNAEDMQSRKTEAEIDSSDFENIFVQQKDAVQNLEADSTKDSKTDTAGRWSSLEQQRSLSRDQTCDADTDYLTDYFPVESNTSEMRRSQFRSKGHFQEDRQTSDKTPMEDNTEEALQDSSVDRVPSPKQIFDEDRASPSLSTLVTPESSWKEPSTDTEVLQSPTYLSFGYPMNDSPIWENPPTFHSAKLHADSADVDEQKSIGAGTGLLLCSVSQSEDTHLETATKDTKENTDNSNAASGSTEEFFRESALSTSEMPVESHTIQFSQVSDVMSGQSFDPFLQQSVSAPPQMPAGASSDATAHEDTTHEDNSSEDDAEIEQESHINVELEPLQMSRVSHTRYTPRSPQAIKTSRKTQSFESTSDVTWHTQVHSSSMERESQISPSENGQKVSPENQQPFFDLQETLSSQQAPPEMDDSTEVMDDNSFDDHQNTREVENEDLMFRATSPEKQSPVGDSDFQTSTSSQQGNFQHQQTTDARKQKAQMAFLKPFPKPRPRKIHSSSKRRPESIDETPEDEDKEGITGISPDADSSGPTFERQESETSEEMCATKVSAELKGTSSWEKFQDDRAGDGLGEDAFTRLARRHSDGGFGKASVKSRTTGIQRPTQLSRRGRQPSGPRLTKHMSLSTPSPVDEETLQIMQTLSQLTKLACSMDDQETSADNSADVSSTEYIEGDHLMSFTSRIVSFSRENSTEPGSGFDQDDHEDENSAMFQSSAHDDDVKRSSLTVEAGERSVDSGSTKWEAFANETSEDKVWSVSEEEQKRVFQQFSSNNVIDDEEITQKTVTSSDGTTTSDSPVMEDFEDNTQTTADSSDQIWTEQDSGTFPARFETLSSTTEEIYQEDQAPREEPPSPSWVDKVVSAAKGAYNSLGEKIKRKKKRKSKMDGTEVSQSDGHLPSGSDENSDDYTDEDSSDENKTEETEEHPEADEPCVVQQPDHFMIEEDGTEFRDHSVKPSESEFRDHSREFESLPSVLANQTRLKSEDSLTLKSACTVFSSNEQLPADAADMRGEHAQDGLDPRSSIQSSAFDENFGRLETTAFERDFPEAQQDSALLATRDPALASETDTGNLMETELTPTSNLLHDLTAAHETQEPSTYQKDVKLDEEDRLHKSSLEAGEYEQFSAVPPNSLEDEETVYYSGPGNVTRTHVDDDDVFTASTDKVKDFSRDQQASSGSSGSKSSTSSSSRPQSRSHSSDMNVDETWPLTSQTQIQQGLVFDNSTAIVEEGYDGFVPRKEERGRPRVYQRKARIQSDSRSNSEADDELEGSAGSYKRFGPGKARAGMNLSLVKDVWGDYEADDDETCSERATPVTEVKPLPGQTVDKSRDQSAEINAEVENTHFKETDSLGQNAEVVCTSEDTREEEKDSAESIAETKQTELLTANQDADDQQSDDVEREAQLHIVAKDIVSSVIASAEETARLEEETEMQGHSENIVQGDLCGVDTSVENDGVKYLSSESTSKVLAGSDPTAVMQKQQTSIEAITVSQGESSVLKQQFDAMNGEILEPPQSQSTAHDVTAVSAEQSLQKYESGSNVSVQASRPTLLTVSTTDMSSIDELQESFGQSDIDDLSIFTDSEKRDWPQTQASKMELAPKDSEQTPEQNAAEESDTRSTQEDVEMLKTEEPGSEVTRDMTNPAEVNREIQEDDLGIDYNRQFSAGTDAELPSPCDARAFSVLASYQQLSKESSGSSSIDVGNSFSRSVDSLSLVNFESEAAAEIEHAMLRGFSSSVDEGETRSVSSFDASSARQTSADASISAVNLPSDGVPLTSKYANENGEETSETNTSTQPDVAETQRSKSPSWMNKAVAKAHQAYSSVEKRFRRKSKKKTRAEGEPSALTDEPNTDDYNAGDSEGSFDENESSYSEEESSEDIETEALKQPTVDIAKDAASAAGVPSTEDKTEEESNSPSSATRHQLQRSLALTSESETLPTLSVREASVMDDTFSPGENAQEAWEENSEPAEQRQRTARFSPEDETDPESADAANAQAGESDTPWLLISQKREPSHHLSTASIEALAYSDRSDDASWSSDSVVESDSYQNMSSPDDDMGPPEDQQHGLESEFSQRFADADETSTFTRPEVYKEELHTEGQTVDRKGLTAEVVECEVSTSVCLQPEEGLVKSGEHDFSFNVKELESPMSEDQPWPGQAIVEEECKAENGQKELVDETDNVFTESESTDYFLEVENPLTSRQFSSEDSDRAFATSTETAYRAWKSHSETDTLLFSDEPWEDNKPDVSTTETASPVIFAVGEEDDTSQNVPQASADDSSQIMLEHSSTLHLEGTESQRAGPEDLDTGRQVCTGPDEENLNTQHSSNDPNSPSWMEKVVTAAKGAYTSLEERLKRKRKKKERNSDEDGEEDGGSEDEEDTDEGIEDEISDEDETEETEVSFADTDVSMLPAMPVDTSCTAYPGTKKEMKDVVTHPGDAWLSLGTEENESGRKLDSDASHQAFGERVTEEESNPPTVEGRADASAEFGNEIPDYEDDTEQAAPTETGERFHSTETQQQNFISDDGQRTLAAPASEDLSSMYSAAHEGQSLTMPEAGQSVHSKEAFNVQHQVTAEGQKHVETVADDNEMSPQPRSVAFPDEGETLAEEQIFPQTEQQLESEYSTAENQQRVLCSESSEIKYQAEHPSTATAQFDGPEDQASVEVKQMVEDHQASYMEDQRAEDEERKFTGNADVQSVLSFDADTEGTLAETMLQYQSSDYEHETLASELQTAVQAAQSDTSPTNDLKETQLFFSAEDGQKTLPESALLTTSSFTDSAVFGSGGTVSVSESGTDMLGGRSVESRYSSADDEQRTISGTTESVLLTTQPDTQSSVSVSEGDNISTHAADLRDYQYNSTENAQESFIGDSDSEAVTPQLETPTNTVGGDTEYTSRDTTEDKTKTLSATSESDTEHIFRATTEHEMRTLSATDESVELAVKPESVEGGMAMLPEVSQAVLMTSQSDTTGNGMETTAGTSESDTEHMSRATTEDGMKTLSAAFESVQLALKPESVEDGMAILDASELALMTKPNANVDGMTAVVGTSESTLQTVKSEGGSAVADLEELVATSLGTDQHRSTEVGQKTLQGTFDSTTLTKQFQSQYADSATSEITSAIDVDEGVMGEVTDTKHHSDEDDQKSIPSIADQLLVSEEADRISAVAEDREKISIPSEDSLETPNIYSAEYREQGALDGVSESLMLATQFDKQTAHIGEGEQSPVSAMEPLENQVNTSEAIFGNPDASLCTEGSATLSFTDAHADMVMATSDRPDTFQQMFNGSENGQRSLQGTPETTIETPKTSSSATDGQTSGVLLKDVSSESQVFASSEDSERSLKRTPDVTVLQSVQSSTSSDWHAGDTQTSVQQTILSSCVDSQRSFEESSEAITQNVQPYSTSGIQSSDVMINSAPSQSEQTYDGSEDEQQVLGESTEAYLQKKSSLSSTSSEWQSSDILTSSTSVQSFVSSEDGQRSLDGSAESVIQRGEFSSTSDLQGGEMLVESVSLQPKHTFLSSEDEQRAIGGTCEGSLEMEQPLSDLPSNEAAASSTITESQQTFVSSEDNQRSMDGASDAVLKMEQSSSSAWQTSETLGSSAELQSQHTFVSIEDNERSMDGTAEADLKMERSSSSDWQSSGTAASSYLLSFVSSEDNQRSMDGTSGTTPEMDQSSDWQNSVTLASFMENQSQKKFVSSEEEHRSMDGTSEASLKMQPASSDWSSSKPADSSTELQSQEAFSSSEVNQRSVDGTTDATLEMEQSSDWQSSETVASSTLVQSQQTFVSSEANQRSVDGTTEATLEMEQSSDLQSSETAPSSTLVQSQQTFVSSEANQRSVDGTAEATLEMEQSSDWQSSETVSSSTLIQSQQTFVSSEENEPSMDDISEAALEMERASASDGQRSETAAGSYQINFDSSKDNQLSVENTFEAALEMDRSSSSVLETGQSPSSHWESSEMLDSFAPLKSQQAFISTEDGHRSVDPTKAALQTGDSSDLESNEILDSSVPLESQQIFISTEDGYRAVKVPEAALRTEESQSSACESSEMLGSSETLQTPQPSPSSEDGHRSLDGTSEAVLENDQSSSFSTQSGQELASSTILQPQESFDSSETKLNSLDGTPEAVVQISQSSSSGWQDSEIMDSTASAQVQSQQTFVGNEDGHRSLEATSEAVLRTVGSSSSDWQSSEMLDSSVSSQSQQTFVSSEDGQRSLERTSESVMRREESSASEWQSSDVMDSSARLQSQQTFFSSEDGQRSADATSEAVLQSGSSDWQSSEMMDSSAPLQSQQVFVSSEDGRRSVEGASESVLQTGQSTSSGFQSNQMLDSAALLQSEQTFFSTEDGQSSLETSSEAVLQREESSTSDWQSGEISDSSALLQSKQTFVSSEDEQRSVEEVSEAVLQARLSSSDWQSSNVTESSAPLQSEQTFASSEDGQRSVEAASESVLQTGQSSSDSQSSEMLDSSAFLQSQQAFVRNEDGQRSVEGTPDTVLQREESSPSEWQSSEVLNASASQQSQQTFVSSEDGQRSLEAASESILQNVQSSSDWQSSAPLQSQQTFVSSEDGQRSVEGAPESVLQREEFSSSDWQSSEAQDSSLSQQSPQTFISSEDGQRSLEAASESTLQNVPSSSDWQTSEGLSTSTSLLSQYAYNCEDEQQFLERSPEGILLREQSDFQGGKALDSASDQFPIASSENELRSMGATSENVLQNSRSSSDWQDSDGVTLSVSSLQLQHQYDPSRSSSDMHQRFISQVSGQTVQASSTRRADSTSLFTSSSQVLTAPAAESPHADSEDGLRTLHGDQDDSTKVLAAESSDLTTTTVRTTVYASHASMTISSAHQLSLDGAWENLDQDNKPLIGGDAGEDLDPDDNRLDQENLDPKNMPFELFKKKKDKKKKKNKDAADKSATDDASSATADPTSTELQTSSVAADGGDVTRTSATEDGSKAKAGDTSDVKIDLKGEDSSAVLQTAEGGTVSMTTAEGPQLAQSEGVVDTQPTKSQGREKESLLHDHSPEGLICCVIL